MIRIIGRKKCSGTKKAERFFKERNIKIQFADLDAKPLTARELDNIFKVISPDDLLNSSSKEYKKRGMGFMLFDKKEELMQDQLLIKTPVILFGKSGCAGYNEDFCKKAEEAEKKS